MYRIEDINIIKKNIGEIQNNADYVYKTTYEPTMTEYNNVIKHILEFIKLKKRIIYGGYAQNQLIKNKNENDVFYSDIDKADIEFYSYEPIKDLVELSDFLYSKNYKMVQGSEGIHEGTYKIFVNLENYCDITYLSKNICDTMKYIEIDGARYSHPYFMYIDYYRIFTDPFSYSFRLDKSFNRYIKLYKYYPLVNPTNTSISIKKTDSIILDKIRKKIIHNSKYIIVGKYALNYYLSKINDKLVDIDFYEIITTNFNIEILKIRKKMMLLFGTKLTIKEFTPYFEFFGNRVEFYVDNILVLRVYNNNNKCIVFRFSENKKCYFGTNQLVILYLLSNYNYSITNKNKVEENNNILMINKLINAKQKYLDSKDKTVMDKTPFEDFTINCDGIALDPRREALLSRASKYKKGLRVSFKYEPSGKQIAIPNYLFKNTSGNQIINEKNLGLKN